MLYKNALKLLAKYGLKEEKVNDHVRVVKHARKSLYFGVGSLGRGVLSSWLVSGDYKSSNKSFTQGLRSLLHEFRRFKKPESLAGSLEVLVRLDRSRHLEAWFFWMAEPDTDETRAEEFAYSDDWIALAREVIRGETDVGILMDRLREKFPEFETALAVAKSTKETM